MSRWSLESWKNYILDQAPGWLDNQELNNTTNQIMGIGLIKNRFIPSERTRIYSSPCLR